MKQQREELNNLASQIEFENMMKNVELKEKLLQWCKKGISLENLESLERVEEYKSLKQVYDRALKQQETIHEFLKSDSLKNLNLGNKVLELEMFQIEGNMLDK